MRFIFLKKRVYLFYFTLVFILSSCVSTQRIFDENVRYLTCKFELIIPTESGAEKINGIVNIEKGKMARISFRAPVVRSELAVLEYSTTGLLVLDRKNKTFAKSSYPIMNDKGIQVVSFDSFERIVWNAARSNKKKVFLLASDFGWNAFGSATIELYQFDNTPFQQRPLRISTKYIESSINSMLESLGLF